MLGILEPTFHVAPGIVVHVWLHVLYGLRPLNCYFALFIMCFDDHFKFRRQQCVSLLFTVAGAVYNSHSQFIVIQMYEGIVLYLSEILLSQNVTWAFFSFLFILYIEKKKKKQKYTIVSYPVNAFLLCINHLMSSFRCTGDSPFEERKHEFKWGRIKSEK